MLILKLFAALVIVGAWLIGVAILRNGVPVAAPPGRFRRILTYLTTNIAETRDDHPFNELRTRHYDMDAENLRVRVKSAIAALEWSDVGGDDSNTLGAEVRTPMLGFTDDVLVTILSVGEQESKLSVRSTSRMGRGDLGANAGHILKLFETIDPGPGSATDDE